MFNTQLEKINFLWKTNLTQEELDNIILDNPEFMESYSLQEKLLKQ